MIEILNILLRQGFGHLNLEFGICLFTHYLFFLCS